MIRRIHLTLSVFMIVFLLMTGTSTAAASDILQVAANQSRVLNFNGIQSIAIANPEIADVVVVSGSEVLLVGKVPGTTTLHVWLPTGRQSYKVEVAADDSAVAAEIRNLLGYSSIRVSKINKTIIIEGTVRDQYQRNRAEKVASAYAEQVVNLLELSKPVQIKLEAKIVEINRTNGKDLGIKWGERYIDKISDDSVTYHDNPPGVFGFGQLEYNPQSMSALGKLGTYRPLNAVLDALIKKGDARILSQPNVITLSGEKADILVGGQIPIPVSSSNGSIAVEWKEYGIKLEIEPYVNGEGLINSVVKAEVSDLDWSSSHQIVLSANLRIPPMTTRKASTSIALSSGQTMAIGGLISRKTEENILKVPFLSDIPVLGKLFQSKSFSKGETELIILITPTIVDPSEYLPQATNEMNEFVKENSWGGKGDAGKNQSPNR